MDFEKGSTEFKIYDVAKMSLWPPSNINLAEMSLWPPQIQSIAYSLPSVFWLRLDHGENVLVAPIIDIPRIVAHIIVLV